MPNLRAAAPNSSKPTLLTRLRNSTSARTGKGRGKKKTNPTKTPRIIKSPRGGPRRSNRLIWGNNNDKRRAPRGSSENASLGQKISGAVGKLRESIARRTSGMGKGKVSI